MATENNNNQVNNDTVIEEESFLSRYGKKIAITTGVVVLAGLGLLAKKYWDELPDVQVVDIAESTVEAVDALLKIKG